MIGRITSIGHRNPAGRESQGDHRMFSDRTGWPLTPNRLSQAVERLRAQGIPILDLAESNPTQVGLQYPEGFLKPLADFRSLVYDPSPKGLSSACQAVVGLYAQKGIPVSADQIFLTCSTSEAYSFLFRLLCNPGDSVLVPCPSYPLFEYLAGLDDVRPSPYRLRYNQKRWEVDFDHLEAACLPTTRAVIVVHPNNPTGSGLASEEWRELISLCQRKNLALVADEVFADYFYEEDQRIPRTLAGNPDVLVFSLGGLSKFLGLPQMKLAWIAVTGPKEMVRPALERLELIADTYLSVNTPVQQALAGWLADPSWIQTRIRERLLRNRRFLLREVGRAGDPIRCLEADGGWNAVLRVPAIRDEEKFTLDLLEQEKVLAHPGYFFDFEEQGYLVVSLLPPPERFEKGVGKLLARIARDVS